MEPPGPGVTFGAGVAVGWAIDGSEAPGVAAAAPVARKAVNDSDHRIRCGDNLTVTPFGMLSADSDEPRWRCHEGRP
jgi:hypothetical protein